MAKVMRGETVVKSPVGPGRVTGLNEHGLPEVNHVAVTWAVFSDGSVYDPYDQYEQIFRQEQALVHAHDDEK